MNAGTFIMGSPETEPGRYDSETEHQVALTHDFVILSTEVTQGDFESLMGYNPSYFTLCGSDCPVEEVSWYEATAYCNALSSSEGYLSCYTCSGSGPDVTCEPSTIYATPYDCPGYRLPTEAEWEYAVRAGTRTSTYNGIIDEDHLGCEQPNPILDPIAWFCGNTVDDATHPVGGRDPNGWGLYDMLGNVWEWCHDEYAEYPVGPVANPWGPPGPIFGSLRVRRGGRWRSIARVARSASRFNASPIDQWDFHGIRPVRSLP